jgi:hypothetical protein
VAITHDKKIDPPQASLRRRDKDFSEVNVEDSHLKCNESICDPHQQSRGARRLQRFPHPLERRRPRHPHPEASQSRVREAAIAGEVRPRRLLFADGLRNQAITLKTRSPGR